MTEPRKTPRTDAELKKISRTLGYESVGEWVTYNGEEYEGDFVTEPFARALEIETQELAEEIEGLMKENERLENLTAQGIHSCHADCQRPMCVLRRERDAAQEEARQWAKSVETLQRQLEVANAETALRERRIVELNRSLAEAAKAEEARVAERNQRIRVLETALREALYAIATLEKAAPFRSLPGDYPIDLSDRITSLLEPVGL